MISYFAEKGKKEKQVRRRAWCCTGNTHRLPKKTYKPITSAAALRERLASCRFGGTIVDRTRLVGERLDLSLRGGHCLFNIGPHFPPVRCREGHAPPLQRMTGGLVKFSTFQFHFPRAASLHMCYPILQKGLLRGSCSRPFAPREGNRQYQRWTTVPASPRTAAPACASEAMMACPPVLANETAALTFGSMEPGAKCPSSQ